MAHDFLLVAAVFVVATGVSLSEADDSWLAKPYYVRLTIDPPDTVVEAAVKRALGSACRFDEPADKEIDVSLRPADGDFELAVQEIDLWMGEAGPRFLERTSTAELVPATAARMAKSAFRPRALIIRRDDEFTASVWGDRLDAELVSESRWFRPFIRFHGRENEWLETTPIAWTFLQMESATRLGRSIRVESALPQPLPGRIRRGNVVALATGPVADSTQVQLVDANTRRVRSGLVVETSPVPRVDTQERLKENADGVSTPGPDTDAERSGGDEHSGEVARAVEPVPSETQRLTADSRGRFMLRNTGDDQLVRVTVRTTTAIAEVPVLPGEKASLTVPLTNDLERVELEERLAAVEYALKDLIARRSVLIAKIQADVEAKRWSEVEAALPKLDDLPGVQSLLGELNAARVAAVDAALARGDRLLASQMRRKAARLERTITSLDEPTLGEDFRADMRTLQEIDAAARKLDSRSSESDEGNDAER